MIFVLFILVILLLIQNLSYKAKYTEMLAREDISNPIDMVYDLEKHLLFETFPVGLDIEDFHFSDGYKILSPNDYLVMVFNLDICGKCLHDALDILGYYREITGQKNVVFLAIAGISDKREESEIIALHKSGDLFFPIKIMKKTDLFDSLKISEPDIVDTPLFFYIAGDFRVLDIFKPRYLETKDLYKWISLILD